MTPQRRRRIIGGVLALVIAALGIAGYWYFRIAGGKGQIEFYGLVIDEQGAPVADAYVSYSPIVGDDLPPQVADVARTDAQGRFHISNIKGNDLYIAGVSKLGYAWVREMDTTYMVPEPPYNHYYAYHPSRLGIQSRYMPDPNRPAIFPLHHEGSTIIGMPSRGGSDRFPDGHVVVNQPFKPINPTTGPGTPTDLRQQMAAKDNYNKRAATQPGGSTP